MEPSHNSPARSLFGNQDQIFQQLPSDSNPDLIHHQFIQLTADNIKLVKEVSYAHQADIDSSALTGTTFHMWCCFHTTTGTTKLPSLRLWLTVISLKRCGVNHDFVRAYGSQIALRNSYIVVNCSFVQEYLQRTRIKSGR